MTDALIAVWKVDHYAPGHAIERTSCTWDGREFSATSFTGSGHALCRALVAAGIPDRPLDVTDAAGKPLYRFRSIHAAAKWTIKRDAREMAPYDPFSGPGEPQK